MHCHVSDSIPRSVCEPSNWAEIPCVLICCAARARLCTQCGSDPLHPGYCTLDCAVRRLGVISHACSMLHRILSETAYCSIKGARTSLCGARRHGPAPSAPEIRRSWLSQCGARDGCSAEEPRYHHNMLCRAEESDERSQNRTRRSRSWAVPPRAFHAV